MSITLDNLFKLKINNVKLLVYLNIMFYICLNQFNNTMKTELKDYKIRINGRHQEVWNQMGRLGYNRDNEDVFMLFPFIFLYADKNWGCNKEESYFKNHKNPEISVDDFLRLGWKPKVGDRVKLTCDGGYTDHKAGDIGVVIKTFGNSAIDVRCDGRTVSRYFHNHETIPIYDSEHVKQEKLDAYLKREDDDSYSLYYWYDNKSNLDSLSRAYQYNLLSEADYKAKYPDKKELPKFAGYEVTVGEDYIGVGCKTYTKMQLSNFMFIGNELQENVPRALYEALDFLNDNKKELGLWDTK